MKTTFRLTYQVVTEESAQNGDFSHHGFVSRSGNFNPGKNYMPGKPAEFSLRDALRIFESHGGHVEANEYPVRCPRWLSSCNESPRGTNGNVLSITLGLHFPDSLTPATRRRIARLVHCYGIK